MKTSLGLLILGLSLISCAGAKTASDVTKDACKITMSADPFVQSLIPTWGSTIDAVVSAICVLPDIIGNFKKLPKENAKQESLKTLKRMSSVKIDSR
jgi:hypothetical protein